MQSGEKNSELLHVRAFTLVSHDSVYEYQPVVSA